ncbi:hypothetical protein [uncultured Amaricoccus sp.]|uniref:hypothetical protein n=1 Tax=uncultured Amaricoccus sp. TaxID=339341 RepID=UPI00261750D8|nr:hypothetical protein [uncultured Amaricoccus sp.]
MTPSTITRIGRLYSDWTGHNPFEDCPSIDPRVILTKMRSSRAELRRAGATIITLAPSDMDQFFADNDGELDDDEAAIRAALSRGDDWIVGGGAAEAFIIRRA